MRRIVGEDGEAPGGIFLQEAGGQLVDQRGLAGAARAGDAQDKRLAAVRGWSGDRRGSRGGFRERDGASEGSVAGKLWFAFERARVVTADRGDDFWQRGAGEEDPVDARALHHPFVRQRD